MLEVWRTEVTAADPDLGVELTVHLGAVSSVLLDDARRYRADDAADDGASYGPRRSRDSAHGGTREGTGRTRLSFMLVSSRRRLRVSALLPLRPHVTLVSGMKTQQDPCAEKAPLVCELGRWEKVNSESFRLGAGNPRRSMGIRSTCLMA
jgi:hypothetical protein